MNKQNRLFKKRIDNAALAMQQVIKEGCAIVSLNIEQSATVIEILPPENPQFTGTQISTIGTATGREHVMVRRIHGCTVRWKNNNYFEVSA